MLGNLFKVLIGQVKGSILVMAVLHEFFKELERLYGLEGVGRFRQNCKKKTILELGLTITANTDECFCLGLRGHAIFLMSV